MGVAVRKLEAADRATAIFAQPDGDALLAEQVGAGHFFGHALREVVQADEATLSSFLAGGPDLQQAVAPSLTAYAILLPK